jgi:hypothetical protein
VGAGTQAVEDLHHGDHGQNLGHYRDDFRILGEEKGQVVAQRSIENQIKDPDDGGREECLCRDKKKQLGICKQVSEQ